MGGLWKPEAVGAKLSVAVLGITPDQARQRVLVRARELSMWLDIHGFGEEWHPADSIHECRWQALPMWMTLEAPLFRQSCALCDAEERATERFLEVGRRTRTGLLWTLRSRPQGIETDRILARLMEGRQRPRRSLIPEGPPARIRAIEALPEAQPFEVAVAIIGRQPVDSLVRFAAREAIMELGTRECQPGTAMELPVDLGVHASFDVLNGGELHGIDRVTSKLLLRWVPGVAEAEEETEETLSRADIQASLKRHSHRH